MPFIEFIAAPPSGGVTPPSPGLNSLVDELDVLSAVPFSSGCPICISKDGSTVFAFGNGSANGVWVWRWNGTNWPNLQILTFSTTSDFTGWTLSLGLRYMHLCCNEDGSRVYLSLPQANSNDGVVYAWHESAGVWTEAERITPPSAGLGASFGGGLACDGTGSRIAIGEPGVDHSTIYDNRGQVHVLTESGGTYSIEQTIVDTATDGNPDGSGTRLGTYCGMSGDGSVLIVGSVGRFGPSFNGFGLLESYTRSGSTWSLEAHHYPSEDDFFMNELAQNHIAISEDATIILIARRDAQFGPPYLTTGHYTRSGGAFVFQSMIGLGPAADFDHPGDPPLRMSSDGSCAIYGDPFDNANGTNDGTIRLWSGPSSWASVSDINHPASPSPNSYEMGRKADISGDGSIVVWTSTTLNPKQVFAQVL